MGMEGRVFQAEGTVCVKAQRCGVHSGNPPLQTQEDLEALSCGEQWGFLTQASYPIEPHVHCHTFEPTYKKFLIFLSLIIQALKRQYTLN